MEQNPLDMTRQEVKQIVLRQCAREKKIVVRNITRR